MELGSRIRTIEIASIRRRITKSFSLPISAVRHMIPQAHEPFDINWKDDSIFLMGSMFIIISLFHV